MDLELYSFLIKSNCSLRNPRYLHNGIQKTEIEWTKPTWPLKQAVTMKSEQGRTMNDFMKLAVEEAKLGLREGGIPIGSVLVKMVESLRGATISVCKRMIRSCTRKLIAFGKQGESAIMSGLRSILH